jgi:hypothetical protein
VGITSSNQQQNMHPVCLIVDHDLHLFAINHEKAFFTGQAEQKLSEGAEET